VSGAPASKSTVLVIDDEAQIRRLLRVSLEAHGYRVFEAATGQAGLTEAAQRQPELVLLDLGLPDMDGVSVLKRLREWSHVPVLVLSVPSLSAPANWWPVCESRSGTRSRRRR